MHIVWWVVIVCAIMKEWDTLKLRLQHLFLAIDRYNNLYVEIFGWCASTQKGDVQKSTFKNESTSRIRMFQTWTDDRPWFRQ